MFKQMFRCCSDPIQRCPAAGFHTFTRQGLLRSTAKSRRKLKSIPFDSTRLAPHSEQGEEKSVAPDFAAQHDDISWPVMHSMRNRVMVRANDGLASRRA